MKSKDSLPEWSKGVDSSSTSASCVGSNPTAVIFANPIHRVEAHICVCDCIVEKCVSEVVQALLEIQMQLPP